MSLNQRPKRKAALRSAIIEISDSNDEFGSDGESPTKRAREDSNKHIERAAQHTAGTGKRQRWPDKQKKSEKQRNTEKNVAKETESTENIAPNVINVDGHVNGKDTEVNTEQVAVCAQHVSAGLPTTTGRSSFWGRRKVWNIHELLSENEHIEPSAARNIVQLFENENTIPFICRYRRDLVNHITPERLRDIKNTYTEIVGLRKKAENIVTQLEKEKVINEDLRSEILSAKTGEELEFLYAPYKPASKGSLSERAKALGLGIYADRLLFGDAPQVQLALIVDRKNADLDSEEKVLNGICHIVSHNISKHTAVLEELRRLQHVHRILLKSTKSRTTASKDSRTAASSTKHKTKKTDVSKFETYFDFQADIKTLKPHQILAINRGEKNKFLSVKLLIPEYLKNDVKRFIRELYMDVGLRYSLRQQVFEKSFEECYSKKLQPLLSRQLRADLNEVAQKAAIDVFAKNLKQLLLMSPLKGKRILGIDPGFTNGCKLALISETADVLQTGVIYPHTRNADLEQCAEKLVKMLTKHNCKIVALGNGTACRETELWLTKLFECGMLDGRYVRYSIVSESGASIYSCSEVARKEFPQMDMNEISAVSIARRLNDPLSEYVKIEPKHIGVGMYQHDVNEKTLTESLNEVVSECVSYVGVDINTASLSVLKHIAGLSEKKAEKIIQHRQTNGAFRTRKDLLAVKSIGEKTYQQCAGFIRIEPLSLGVNCVDNVLDSTWIHPESYLVAKKIISKCKLQLNQIGTDEFITTIKNFTTDANIKDISAEFKIPKERLEIVFVALQRRLNQDYRADIDKRPLFKQGVTKLTDLSVGDVVTGAVTNVTHFGAFVDIGVECDGLIHISHMQKARLSVGERVTASIIKLDVQRRRIGLRLEEMLDTTDTSFTIKCEFK